MASMRRVGERLRDQRLRKKLSLADITGITKIKQNYLQAIEDGNYSDLPQITFTKGLIRNYAKAVGLDPEELSAVFRREYDERRAPVDAKAPAIQTPTSLHITPTTVIRLVIGIVVAISVIYFIREYRILAGPPRLVVNSPKQNEEISNQTISVSGKTVPEVSLTVNGQPILVNPDGTFKTEIVVPQLPEDTKQQLYTVKIDAKAKSEKVSSITRTIVINR